MHCQEPEKQLKLIPHRRTTPNSSKPKPNFSGTRYKQPAEVGERKTASLNFEKDGPKLWRPTKQLSDEGNSRAKIILLENSKLLTGKQAADAFADNYANESNIPLQYFKAERSKEKD